MLFHCFSNHSTAGVVGFLPAVFLGYTGQIGAIGEATASMRIPHAAALVGVRIYTAFVTLDPGAQLGIQSISNTHSLTVTP